MNRPSPQSLKNWLEFNDFNSSKFTSGKWIPLKINITDEQDDTRIYFSLETLIVFDEDREKYAHLSWQDIGLHREETTAYVDEDRFYSPTDYYDYQHGKVTGIMPITDLWHEDGERVWDLNQEIVLSLRLLRQGDTWVRPSENYLEVAQLVRNDESGKPIEIRIKADVLRDYLKARSTSLFSAGFMCREFKGNSLHDVDWQEEHINIDNDTQEWHGYKGKTDDDEELNFLFGKLWWKDWLEKSSVSTRVAGDKHPDRIAFFVDNQSEDTKSLEEIKKDFQFLCFEPSLVTSILKEQRAFIEWWAFDAGKLGIGHSDFTFGVNELGKVVIFAKDLKNLPHWFLKKLKSYNIIPEGGIGKALYDSYIQGWFSDSIAPENLLHKSLIELNSAFISRFGCPLFNEIPAEREFLKHIHRFDSDNKEDFCHLAKELNKLTNEAINGANIYKNLGEEGQTKFKGKKAQIRNMLAALIDELGGDGREETRILAGINDLRQLDAHSGSSGYERALKILGFESPPDDLQGAAILVFEGLTKAADQITRLVLA
ncbi:hypothetical protein [Roseibacillus ishigakijimensis]|uniref:ApeA N-terminal domain-containing protein n=1 Tax=Roseibacillus ishigakijimensis TaxID=454146 RepID=A0A934RPD4_9BACT|nr:hypothetical protein [Roseibacillus ishigakijimensis]MBK1833038.1 hypothetical protein [Roseibacillus ishigakijimensis]